MGKLKLPALLGLLAVTLFMGCRAEIDVRRGRHYGGGIWGGDPYCRYSWDYGCNYYGNDGWRVRVIQDRRWGGRWGNVMDVNSAVAQADAKKPTTWAKEFNLPNSAVNFIKNSFENSLNGDTQQLQAIGVSFADINGMQDYKMPSAQSIANAAQTLRVKQGDLSDFIEVFLIRMKTAMASDRS